MSIWTEFAGLQVKQTYYNVKGIRTRVIEGGEGNAETLICLHGTGGHAEAFARNFRTHTKHFRVISMDMIGHGYTDAPDIEYTMDTFRDHVADMIDTLGIKSACITGESLGGMVGAHVAIKYPEKVKKLVMNTGVLVDRTPEDRVALQDLLDRSKRATGELTKDAVRQRLNWLMHNPERDVTDELIDIRYAVYTQPGRAKIIGRIGQLIMGGLLTDEWTLKYSNQKDLEKIQCPTLILWTKYNPDLSAENARKALPHLKKGQMIVLENSAHWPQWEETELYDKVHLGFLQA